MNDFLFVCIVIMMVGTIGILAWVAYSVVNVDQVKEVKHLTQILTTQQKPKVIVIYGDTGQVIVKR